MHSNLSLVSNSPTSTQSAMIVAADVVVVVVVEDVLVIYS